MATRTFSFWSSIYHWNGDFIAFLLVVLFCDYLILCPSHFFFVIALILLSRTREKSIPITFFSCSSAEEKLLCNSKLVQNSGPNIMHYTQRLLTLISSWGPRLGLTHPDSRLFSGGTSLECLIYPTLNPSHFFLRDRVTSLVKVIITHCPQEPLRQDLLAE